MAVVKADVLARWPKLATITDDTEWAAAIADAGALVPAAVWGALVDQATIHLIAHSLFAGHAELSTGQVQSESVAGVSRSYAVAPASSSGGYQRTLAGQAYLRLRGTLGLGFTVT